MAQETLTIEGVKYESDDSLVFGDYGGAGSVGKANIKVLQEQFPDFIDMGMDYEAIERGWKEVDQFDPANPPILIMAYGGYGSEQAWLLSDNEEVQDILRGLADYPAIDDEAISEIEMEWESEAWESWLRSDLMKTLPEELEEAADELPDEELFEAYRQAMDETNTYPTPEYNGVHVDVDRISGAFAEILAEKLG